ncbi:MAG: glycosyltransferase family 4 protein, partial [Rhodovibrionaceae bacterium]
GARAGAAYIYWLQDIYCLALAHRLAQHGGLGRFAALPLALLRRIEFSTLKRSDAAVAISADFREILAGEGVILGRLAVIENWAPAGEIDARPKDNPWARAQGLADKFVFLYSGTLGMKHDPGLLSALAEAFRDDPEVRVAVISQGAGRRWLEQEKTRRKLDNLLLFDFQPFEVLSDVLATGDLQLVLLEPFAGRLSVPSKTLSCLAAERPVLSVMPPDNLAARLLAESGAGVNLAPGDTEGFLAAARKLRGDREALVRMGAAARAYKDAHFDIEKIGPRFLAVFEEALTKLRT